MAAREGDRGEDAESDGADARERSYECAGLKSGAEVAVRQELVVPVEREPAQRERGELGLVEREDEQDDERGVEEGHNEPEEDAERPASRFRDGSIHQRAAA